MNTDQLIAAVKQHALEHYEQDGWDVVVECYTDVMLAEIIEGARTAAGAIRKVQAYIKPFAEYRADIQAEAF